MSDQTESRIRIAAAPAVVMAVIADLEAYPQWAEGVAAVELLEVYEDGLPATILMTIDSAPIKDTVTLEYTWFGDDHVDWVLVKGGTVTRNDGTYQLTDNDDGTTTVAYRLVVDISIPMIGMIKRRAEKIIVDTALKGLKKRVEG